jgi:hypothetical protein
MTRFQLNPDGTAAEVDEKGRLVRVHSRQNVEDLLNSLHSAGDGRCGKSDYQYTCGGEGPLDSVEMHTDAEIEAGIIAAFVAEGGREDMVAAFREAVRKVREASDGSA